MFSGLIYNRNGTICENFIRIPGLQMGQDGLFCECFQKGSHFGNGTVLFFLVSVDLYASPSVHGIIPQYMTGSRTWDAKSGSIFLQVLLSHRYWT